MAPLTCEKHHCKSLPPAGQPPPPAPVDTPGASGPRGPARPPLPPPPQTPRPPAPCGPHLPWPAGGGRVPSRRRTKAASAARLPLEHLNPAAAASAGQGFFSPFQNGAQCPSPCSVTSSPSASGRGVPRAALGGAGRAAAGAAGGCREAPSASARAAPRFAPGPASGAPGRPGPSRPAGGCGPRAGAALKTSRRAAAIRPLSRGLWAGSRRPRPS